MKQTNVNFNSELFDHLDKNGYLDLAAMIEDKEKIKQLKPFFLGDDDFNAFICYVLLNKKVPLVVTNFSAYYIKKVNLIENYAPYLALSPEQQMALNEELLGLKTKYPKLFDAKPNMQIAALPKILKTTGIADLADIIENKDFIKHKFNYTDHDFEQFVKQLVSDEKFIRNKIINNGYFFEKMAIIEDYAQHCSPQLRDTLYDLLLNSKLSNLSTSQMIELQKQVFDKHHQYQDQDQVILPGVDKFSSHKKNAIHAVKAGHPEGALTDESAEKIANNKGIINSTVLHQYELKRQIKRIESGKALQDDITRNYLLSLKSYIKAGSFHTRFGGGVHIPGLNKEQLLPDTIAALYHRIESGLERGDCHEVILNDFAVLADTAKRKASGCQFFFKRDAGTIAFYKKFSQDFERFSQEIKKFNQGLALPERISKCAFGRSP